MKKISFVNSAFLSLYALTSLQNHTYAYEIVDESIYSEIAINFFKNQYSINDIKYNNLNIEYIKDMKDYNENVVAKVIGLNGDNKHDYVLLNIATSQIDEFLIDGRGFKVYE